MNACATTLGCLMVLLAGCVTHRPAGQRLDCETRGAARPDGVRAAVDEAIVGPDVFVVIKANEGPAGAHIGKR